MSMPLPLPRWRPVVVQTRLADVTLRRTPSASNDHTGQAIVELHLQGGKLVAHVAGRETASKQELAAPHLIVNHHAPTHLMRIQQAEQKLNALNALVATQLAGSCAAHGAGGAIFLGAAAAACKGAVAGPSGAALGALIGMCSGVYRARQVRLSNVAELRALRELQKVLQLAIRLNPVHATEPVDPTELVAELNAIDLQQANLPDSVTRAYLELRDFLSMLAQSDVTLAGVLIAHDATHTGRLLAGRAPCLR